MVHAIDMTNGRANMAYMGVRPWHGLGTVLQEGASLEDWTKAAGLNWHAEVLPSLYQLPDDAFTGVGTGIEAGQRLITSNDFHIVRNDTWKSLGVMSARYNPVQPIEVMEFFRDFILTDDRFKLETAGSLKGGRVIWALAKFQEDILAGGDKHTPYVLLTTSYNGSLATTAQATLIRVVCNNTLTASIFSKRAATIKVPHSRKWTEDVRADAHARLEFASEAFGEYQALADALRGTRMARHQTEEFLKGLIQPPLKAGQLAHSGRIQANYDRLFAAWLVTSAETEGNTAWAALNAVTRYVDHERTTRRGDSEESVEGSRMASSFFGSGAVMKSTAINKLVELGGFIREPHLVAA